MKEQNNKVTFISGFEKFEALFLREHPTQDGSIAIDAIAFEPEEKVEDINDTFRILYRFDDEPVSGNQLVFNKVIPTEYDASKDVRIAYDVENSVVHGFSYFDSNGKINVLTGPTAAKYFYMFMGIYNNKGESRTRKD